MAPTFFPTPAHFRRWLERHHASKSELLVGFFKRGSGKPSITWPESVDEALCFGWIDGVRRKLDEESYTIRFTPRKKDSNWSAINIGRVAALREEGRMQAAGLAAFELRREDRSAIYAYENRPVDLDPESEKKLRANRKAWSFWLAQPPWYRRTVSYWVLSAKKEETRERRLAALIADSAEGRVVGPVKQVGKKVTPS